MLTSKSLCSLEQTISRLDAKSAIPPGQEVILTRLLFVLIPRLTAHLNEVLKQYGLNETAWMALLTLYAAPNQTLYPSELSETLSTSRTHATRLTDDLLKQGWLVRTHCEEDRRKVLLTLSEQGETQIQALRPKVWQCQKNLWSVFSAEEKQQFERLLRKLLSRLED